MGGKCSLVLREQEGMAAVKVITGGLVFFSFLKTRTLQLATAVLLPFPSMLMSSTAFLVCLLLSRNQAGESAKC